MATENGDGYADELIQGPISHASLPVKRGATKTKFAPWHKPRKHWVRMYQWGRESKKLIEEMSLVDGRSLRYLTLPGPDMLDIRYMCEVCEELKIRLNFVGYIHADQNDLTELHISQSEVMRMAFVDEGSRIVEDDFQTLATSRSVGSSKIDGEASFDVINIDLCKCIGEFEPDDKQRAYYDSIFELLKLQVHKRAAAEPWLLFITTRADFDRVNAKSRTKFFDQLIEAFKHSEAIQGALSLQFGLTIDDLARCRDGKVPSDLPFERLFAVAFGEWIGHLLMSFTPQVRVELLRSSRGYGVKRPKLDDMLSLAFRCQTVYLQGGDESGLATTEKSSHTARLTEHETVAEMIDTLADMPNIDVAFNSTRGYNTLTHPAATFMARANFDLDAYIRWAWEDCPEADEARRGKRD